MYTLNDYNTCSGIRIAAPSFPGLRKANIITESDLGCEQQAVQDATKSDVEQMLSLLVSGTSFDLMPGTFLDYYRRCAPVFNAINMIVDEGKSVPLRVWNPSRQTFVTRHPIFSLFNNPNPIEPLTAFLDKLFTYYEATGNTFILANLSGATGEPLTIQAIHPDAVDVQRSDVTGLPESYMLDSDGALAGLMFQGRIINGQLRFRAGNRELYHIKTLNTDISQSNLWGMSKLNPILPEITQYILSGTHNTSLLQKGGRIPGAIVTDRVLSQPQLDQIREDKKEFEGAENAGRLAVFHGGMKYMQFGSSNRDMDFTAMKEQVTTTIYNNFKIPLAFVHPNRMTLSNLEVSILQLYDRAVLPFLRTIFPELTKMLMPLYPNSNNLIITYNDKDIPALEIRRLNQQKLMNQTESYTINEVRSVAASKPLDGGDLVYRQSNQIPVAGKGFEEAQNAQQQSSNNTNNQDNLDSPDIQEEAKAIAKDIFIKMLEQAVNDDGKNTYSDKDIDSIVEKTFREED